MYPNILERDSRIYDWPTKLAGWCTTVSALSSTTLTVRSDGTLYSNGYGTLSIQADTGVLGAREATAVGLHIQGPEDLSGSEFTPYLIEACAWSEDDEVRPFLFMGETSAVITSGAGGHSVTPWHFLHAPDQHSSEGGALNYCGAVLVNPNTADRGVCFGIGMSAGPSGAATLGGYGYMCVRRLTEVAPTIFDGRKLG